jgi:2-keto-4-pentenoate hydratase/2-oxohepta-3-ene-1,7-dioic acid hydratase in catechol pathway
MRLASFAIEGRQTWGAILKDDGVVDLGRRLPAYPSLQTALQADALDEARALATAAHVDASLSQIQLERPIAWPEKIVCVGVNYAERNEEYKDQTKAAQYPSLFIRFPDSLVAHGQPILRPPESLQLDYEGEIVVVIGRGGRRIPERQAPEHIAGLTIMNEGTIRDWLRHGKFNVTQGKNFVASGSIGPWIVTREACPPLTDLTLTTRVNGEVRQHDNTSRMAFPIAYLISYISTMMLLKPGDLIATGTPAGAGARREPPVWLTAGDVVEVSVDGVGTLVNPIADEA